VLISLVSAVKGTKISEKGGKVRTGAHALRNARGYYCKVDECYV